ncbi:hypothetical protein FSP39_001876 [Pinctada imbricata]|uniref:DNA-directed RNA polymerase III subunit n=1 Tax=Pinctada imbricata TaxID=66713 RepID=A0AA89BW58_PINIB|nr:hypothetical protein FSP39_001876 [Pinctada imbricata]
MAGRGRGRGRSVSFNVEALGFGRGEALPGPIQQPPPLFPTVEFHPIPLGQGDEYDYMLALKQEFRVMMRKSPYSVTTNEKRKDIVRYSDKYRWQQGNVETVEEWTPDYSILPAELKPKKVRRTKRSVKPNIPVKKRKVEDKDITKTLEELEKKEETSKEDVEGEDDDEEDAEKKGEDGEEEIEEEDFEEEEAEEVRFELSLEHVENVFLVKNIL